MKYLLLGLALVLLAPTMRPSAAVSSRPHYRADVWGQERDATGVSTDLTVEVEMEGSEVAVRLTIERTTPDCLDNPQTCPAGAISGSMTVPAKTGDFVVASTLAWAALHISMDVKDVRSGNTITIRIDLAWTATGQPYVGDGALPATVVAASARGVVMSTSTDYLAGSSLWNATIARW